MDYYLLPLSLRKTSIAGPHRPNESEEERNGVGRSFLTRAILFGFSRKTLEGTISCEAMHFFNGKLEQSWNRFDQIVLKPGYRWYGKARVWHEQKLETSVILAWVPGCKKPWLLTSDQREGRRNVQEYVWRMHVEAT